MTAQIFAIKQIRNQIVNAGLNDLFGSLRQTLKRLFNSLVKDHGYTKEEMNGVVSDLIKRAPLGAQDPAVILAQAVVTEVAAAMMVAYANEAHELHERKAKLLKEIAEIDQTLEESRADRELFQYSREELLSYGNAS